MIISVASGKGGTGKTTVAVWLALAAGRVTLVDCDVEEPNAEIFLKPDIDSLVPVYASIPVLRAARCSGCGECSRLCRFNAITVVNKRVILLPQLCHSCGLCVEACPEKALTEENRKIGIIKRGRRGLVNFIAGELDPGEARSSPLIRKLKQEPVVSDHVIRDCPPGTACPVIDSIAGSDFCILVTEPTPFGLHDLKASLKLVRRLGIPHGVIINRDGIGDSRAIIDYCREEKAELLMSIPHDIKIAESYARGITLNQIDSDWERLGAALFQKLVQRYQSTENKK